MIEYKTFENEKALVDFINAQTEPIAIFAISGLTLYYGERIPLSFSPKRGRPKKAVVEDQPVVLDDMPVM